MKRTLIAALAAIALNAHAIGAGAGAFFTGNDLLRNINDEDNIVRKSMALGYVVGVHDTLNGAVICSPGSVTTGQIRDMVKIWLENNPTERHRPADVLITYVFKRVWPCPTTNNGPTY